MQKELPARTAYRISEVADTLGVHRDTVRRWARDGDIRVVAIAGTRLIPATELERLLEQPAPDAA